MSTIVQKKPGRGDATLSMSCCDKIARWSVVGVQGFLFIFHLEESILTCCLFASSIIIFPSIIVFSRNNLEHVLS